MARNMFGGIGIAISTNLCSAHGSPPKASSVIVAIW